MSTSLLHLDWWKTKIRMLKLYCYPSFQTPVYKHTDTQAENQDDKKSPLSCTRMLEDPSPRPDSLAPTKIRKATSIVTSRHDS